MAKAKVKREKPRKMTIPGIIDFKALNRPVQLVEDKLALPPQGVHRPHSAAGFGTGAGEWGFHAANRHRPKPIRHLVDHEEAMERSQLMVEVEGWIRDCARGVVERTGARPARTLRDVRVVHEYFLAGMVVQYRRP